MRADRVSWTGPKWLERVDRGWYVLAMEVGIESAERAMERAGWFGFVFLRFGPLPCSERGSSGGETVGGIEAAG